MFHNDQAIVGGLCSSSSSGLVHLVDDPGIGFLCLLVSMVYVSGLQVLWVILFAPYRIAFGRSPSLGLLGMGAMGVVNLCLGWIGIVVGHYTGLETFELPTGRALAGVLITGATDLVLNLTSLVAILLLTPLFVNVAGLLSVPLSLVVQVLLVQSPVNAWTISGAVLMMVGSVLFQFAELVYGWLKKRRAKAVVVEVEDVSAAKSETEKLIEK